jgi:hypothetical protein
MRSDDLIKGAAIGVGLALLVPVAVAALAPVLKPLARSALRTGVMAYEKGRETLEELGETLEDVKAEVEDELAGQHATTADMGDMDEQPAESANTDPLH